MREKLGRYDQKLAIREVELEHVSGILLLELQPDDRAAQVHEIAGAVALLVFVDRHNHLDIVREHSILREVEW